MKQNIQIVLAFLIPFVLAVGLAMLSDYFFPQSYCTTEVRGEEVCFSYHDHGSPTTFTEGVYMFLTISLFLASLILPAFITRRAYQRKLSEINSKTIFK